MKLKVSLLAITVLCLASLAYADVCGHCYYLTAGDQGRMTIVNLDNQTWWQTSLSGNEYAIAVYPAFEITVGAYQNNGATYDPSGNFIATVNNANVIPGSQWLDGTTDLNGHNYTVDFYNYNVYQTDIAFNNAQVMFGVGYGVIGITYQSGNNSLWIADRYGIPGRITDYDMAGTPLFYFDTGISFISALAYDSTDNSLWVTTFDCALGTCLYEYDLSGNLINSFDIPVYDNIIGGEIGGIPEPGTLMLLGSGVLAVMGAIRRRL